MKGDGQSGVVAESGVVQLNHQEILALLPHRFPLLMLDRVTELEPGRRGVGYKNVTANEQFFVGHFPGNPMMPGVLIVEAMAQLAALVALMAMDRQERPELYLMSMDRVKFRRPVVPGDRLDLHAVVLQRKGGHWKMGCRAEVDGRLAAQAELLAGLR